MATVLVPLDKAHYLHLSHPLSPTETGDKHKPYWPLWLGEGEGLLANTALLINFDEKKKELMLIRYITKNAPRQKSQVIFLFCGRNQLIEEQYTVVD